MTPAVLNPGVLYAALAFTVWGLYPLYFRLLATVSAHEVVLQRSVWSFAVIVLMLMVMRRWAWLKTLAQTPRQLWTYGASALFISANWLVYVYAVNSGHVLEASLGYFINPLFSVALGVMVLRERLRTVQWVAVAIATAGVLWLTWAAGKPPWLALAMAALFAAYGLVRKTARLGALEGLAVETALMAIVATPLLVWLTVSQGGALSRGDIPLTAWLIASGPLTVVPLLLFTAAARRLPLASVGLLQYISPSLQFVLGVWVFGEAFDTTRLVGFVLIWLALLIYSADVLRFTLPRPAPEPLH
jgi:chloramphenicol-sensitive protein RarD